jgi:hypothetical protein
MVAGWQLYYSLAEKFNFHLPESSSVVTAIARRLLLTNPTGRRVVFTSLPLINMKNRDSGKLKRTNVQMFLLNLFQLLILLLHLMLSA